MATIQKFEDLEVWQKSRLLENVIFELTLTGKLYKDFDLKNQMNRSSGSIMDNIAEGFGRGGRNEFIQFLAIARGSGTELQSQLHRCIDRKYISEEEFLETYNKIEEVLKMLTGFINYLNKTTVKGQKFKDRKDGTQNY
ncbi:MAG: four helix bundle protein [Flavobacterium sp.]|nr:four helix bundle protein [Flavobacterium sp.]